MRLAITAFLLTSVGFAQEFEDREATVRGGGGNTGKCTIEVEVDGVAEVGVKGSRGRIRTLAGAPARWRRFECDAALPNQVSDFRFRGLDGRGRQTLASDPRSNDGVAIVRIEDPRGGSHGYTFEIEWSGGSGSTGGGGFFGDGPRRGQGNADGYSGDSSQGGGFRRRPAEGSTDNSMTSGTPVTAVASVSGSCDEAVREEARRRGMPYIRINARGANDGEFEAGVDPSRDYYSFSCNGRSVNINRLQAGSTASVAPAAPAAGSNANTGGFFPSGGSAATSATAPDQACEDAVRDQALRQYRVRTAEFGTIRQDANPGRGDFLVGTFRDSDRGTNYFFSCRMAGARVRSVTVEAAQ